MKSRMIIALSSALALNLSALVPAHAGSERLIMRITVPEMIERGLVHVRLVDGAGELIEGNEQKAVAVHDGDCSGALLEAIYDYKFGYFPEGRVSGLFLMPSTWQGRSLCIEVAGKGSVNIAIPDGSAGQSLSFTLTPGVAPSR